MNSDGLWPNTATADPYPQSSDGRQTAFDKRLRSTGGLKSRTSCGDVFGIAESNGLAEGIRFKGRRPQGRLTTRSLATPVLVLLGHESSALHRGLIIVSSFLGALRQFYLLPGRLAVRNQAQ